MAVYQKHFNYQNKSNTDFGLYVVTFSPDNGESESYLSMESIYTDNYNGTMRYDYGAKYDATTMLYITMIKDNYSDFSQTELRQILNWLTGLRQVSWLDLYKDDSDEISFSFLGRVTDVKLQKMDARVIGLKVEFTSVSPWAYSGIRQYDLSLDGSELLYPILNASDEDSVYVYPKIVFTNKNANGSLQLLNITTNKITTLKNLAMNEIVTMDSNKIIYSDNSSKIFGEDFNYQWLCFVQGYNYLKITGTGHLVIEYRDIFKVAEAFDGNDSINSGLINQNVLLITEIELLHSRWVRETNSKEGTIYTQALSLENTTENSKINLQPTGEQLLALQEQDVELQIVNNNGTIMAYAYGTAPTANLKIQATIEETNKNLVYSYASAILYANAWYGQGDIYTQPIYIKDLTSNSIIDINITDLQAALLEDSETVLFIQNNNGKPIAYAVGYKPNIDYEVGLTITETTVQN